VTLAAPFAGFFLYRFNHPAFFSLCYAPWALYCWVRVAEARTMRPASWWAAGLILANTALLNSGTAKEAYMLLLTMNFSGLCLLLAHGEPWRRRLGKVAGLVWAGGLFLLLNAPMWYAFVHSLTGAYTAYNAPTAFQIQPALLLGLFDELFYRPLTVGGLVFDPSLNLLLLAGVLYFLATLREQFARPAVRALALSSLLPLAFAFGLVPPSWITRVPFFGNISHIDNCFSCALIVLWSVLAGAGFAQAAARLGTRAGRGDLLVGGGLLFALVFAWIGFHQAVHRSVQGLGLTLSAIKEGAPPVIDGFVWGSLAAEVVAIVGLGWVARRGLARGVLTAAGAILATACAVVLLWRQALHTPAVGYAEYGIRPTERVDFHAPSEAMELVRASQAREPTRAFGLRGSFFPGWSADYGIESISGPDPLVNPYFREFLNKSGLSIMWDWRLQIDPEGAAAARPILDFLNVRYYLDVATDRAALAPTLTLTHPADLDVYESATVWPRAFFTDRIDVYDDPTELMPRIRSANGRPFAAVQRLDYGATSALIALPRGFEDRTVAPASNYRLTSNSTSFEVHANRPGVVVLSEVLWPGDFRAEVNGKKAGVVRLNHTFKGVVVDAPGDYRVTFRYVPKRWPYIMIACGAGAALLLASLFVVGRAGRERREPA
jgi:hypothetical protein